MAKVVFRRSLLAAGGRVLGRRLLAREHHWHRHHARHLGESLAARSLLLHHHHGHVLVVLVQHHLLLHDQLLIVQVLLLNCHALRGSHRHLHWHHSWHLWHLRHLGDLGLSRLRVSNGGCLGFLLCGSLGFLFVGSWFLGRFGLLLNWSHGFSNGLLDGFSGSICRTSCLLISVLGFVNGARTLLLLVAALATYLLLAFELLSFLLLGVAAFDRCRGAVSVDNLSGDCFGKGLSLFFLFLFRVVGLGLGRGLLSLFGLPQSFGSFLFGAAGFNLSLLLGTALVLFLALLEFDGHLLAALSFFLALLGACDPFVLDLLAGFCLGPLEVFKALVLALSLLAVQLLADLCLVELVLHADTYDVVILNKRWLGQALTERP